MKDINTIMGHEKEEEDAELVFSNKELTIENTEEMQCLYCGSCCRTMSPFTGSEHEPCPHLEEYVDGFFFCRIYDSRPEQCTAHTYLNYKYCPVGLGVRNLKHAIDLSRTIDFGWELLKSYNRKTDQPFTRAGELHGTD
jgi:hypothetical protein